MVQMFDTKGPITEPVCTISPPGPVLYVSPGKVSNDVTYVMSSLIG